MPILRESAASYATADFLRRDCDLKLDMSKMPEIKGGSFDVVIALDVLEHVPDFQVAVVDASIFPEGLVREHVLFQPFPSKHSLATNFRKVYFCRTSLDPRPSAR